MASVALTTATGTTSFPALPSLRLRSPNPIPSRTSRLCCSASGSLHSFNFKGLKQNSFSSIPPPRLSKSGFNVKPHWKYPSVKASASGASLASSPPPAPTPQPWRGAAIKPLLASIATGVLIWFAPVPAGVSKNAWQLLAIFLGTIVGIISQPLPLGAVAILGLGVSVLTKTLTFAAAFSGFGDPIPWLICLAFFFARGFIKTGLGNRIAYQFVSLFGSSSLGLGYSLVFSEALLAPAIPSVSARAGGIFLPLVKSLCVACGSNAGDGTEDRLGSWLMLTCFQTSVISSAMFLTAMAANPLCATLTANSINQTIGWLDWAKAAIVPGLVSLVLVPLILYVIYPPTVKASPDAPKLAREKLQQMGPMTTEEKTMAITLFLTVGLWIFGAALKVDAVSAAILGLSVLLVTGVVTWKECLAEGVAWDTLTWFAALIAMAGYLNKYGLISWFSQTVVKFVGGLGLSWQLSFGILVLLYFYSHYFFASGAAHIGAMFTAFLSVASALGTPPYFGAMVLSFLSNLMGGLTHYGIGSAPVFFGANYVPLAKWWGYGFLMSIVNIIIWLGVGGVWWKAIGLW
ncbi:LOW QUALITY PROTEIN: dicarboxylate transporter 1, chloroplastic-like [Neltuma alba]|uniref:LOW QUALITY PROTEIN: dicarboxylate transporter 1, chloroplastic-like n=1 Tax=Neltuma alba TaxID=207710 RepID=UPI0010A3CABB|nr:LOW QUALITY PROTEIN: dicarboxylate transporter 1, chloroplastic-like [Prosopis alba]